VRDCHVKFVFLGVAYLIACDSRHSIVDYCFFVVRFGSDVSSSCLAARSWDTLAAPRLWICVRTDENEKHDKVSAWKRDSYVIVWCKYYSTQSRSQTSDT
jgi:hypothetical protein